MTMTEIVTTQTPKSEPAKPAKPERLNAFVRALKSGKVAELLLSKAAYEVALKRTSHFAVNCYIPSTDFDGVDILLRVETANSEIRYIAVAVVSRMHAGLHLGSINAISVVANRHVTAGMPYFLVMRRPGTEDFAVFSGAQIVASQARYLRPAENAFMTAEQVVEAIILSPFSA